MKNSPHNTLPWWKWMWLVHIGFISVMAVFLFFRTPGWFRQSYSTLSLAHEMNYAVWWAGICLFVAAAIFYRIGSSYQRLSPQMMSWHLLALTMFALFIDEVGSLHELVSLHGGWLGLAPFALIFFIAFSYSAFHIFAHRDTRIAAILVIVGLGLYVAVAGLEFVEHNIRIEEKWLQKLRLVGEESIELLGTSLILMAGLISMNYRGMTDRSWANVMGRFEQLALHSHIIFVLLIIQFVGTIGVSIPNYFGVFEGNPTSVFPIFLFFCLAMHCLIRRRDNNLQSQWGMLAIVFLATSILQTRNFNGFINRVYSLSVDWFDSPPATWWLTLLPFVLLALQLTRYKHITFSMLFKQIFIVAVAFCMLWPGAPRELTYYLFSSVVAYASYMLLATSSTCYGNRTKRL